MHRQTEEINRLALTGGKPEAKSKHPPAQGHPRDRTPPLPSARGGESRAGAALQPKPATGKLTGGVKRLWGQGSLKLLLSHGESWSLPREGSGHKEGVLDEGTEVRKPWE